MKHVESLVEPLRHLVHNLEERALPYAVGGAIALGYWGVPRATLDIDITLWFAPGGEKKVVESLYGCGATGPSIERVVSDWRDNGVAYLSFEGIRLDVFSPSIPFYDQAFNERVRVELPEVGPTWMLSAETLIVFKLLFFRAKDLADIERLLRVQQSNLRTGSVRTAVIDVVGEDDERVKWYETQLRGLGIV